MAFEFDEFKKTAASIAIFGAVAVAGFAGHTYADRYQQNQVADCNRTYSSNKAERNTCTSNIQDTVENITGIAELAEGIGSIGLALSLFKLLGELN